MALGLAALATLVGAGTYVYAKSKNATNGTAAVAGVASGATAALVSALFPVLMIAGIIGVPAAGVYYFFNKDRQKALGPARDDF